MSNRRVVNHSVSSCSNRIPTFTPSVKPDFSCSWQRKQTIPMIQSLSFKRISKTDGASPSPKVRHVVVLNVVQTQQAVKAHMVIDINDVAIYNGHNSSKLKYAAQANGNIIVSVADVYDVVKRNNREKGGGRYSVTQKNKNQSPWGGFSCSHGVFFS